MRHVPRWSAVFALLLLAGCPEKKDEPAAQATPAASPGPAAAVAAGEAPVQTGELTPYPIDATPLADGVVLPPTGEGQEAMVPPADTKDSMASVDADAVVPDAANGTWDPSSEQTRSALDEYGTWSQTPEYGEVWAPKAVPNNWRPYQQGHWVNSSQGWLWQGDEPWAWLPYHYGHWVYMARLGWVWVPGDTWVPSQVAWRTSNQYAAWAPMPPGRVSVDVIPPAAWVVVPTAHFMAPRLTRYVVAPTYVAPLLARARPVTVARRVGKVTYFPGPDVVVVKRWVGFAPRPVPVSIWRAGVPVTYRAHYDHGRHLGWYKAPPAMRHGGVEVDRYGRVGHTEVEVKGRGRHKEVEVDRHGARVNTEVEVERHGRHKSVEVDRSGRGGRGVEVEVDRHGRRVEVEVDKSGRGGKKVYSSAPPPARPR